MPLNPKENEKRKKRQEKILGIQESEYARPGLFSGDDMGALLRVPLYFGRKKENPASQILRPCPASCKCNQRSTQSSHDEVCESLWSG